VLGVGRKESYGEFFSTDFYIVGLCSKKEHSFKLFRETIIFTYLRTKASILWSSILLRIKNKPFFLYYAPYVSTYFLAASKDLLDLRMRRAYMEINVHELDFFMAKLLKNPDSLKIDRKYNVLLTVIMVHFYGNQQGIPTFRR